MATDSDGRRMIFDRVRTKAAVRGMPIDDDPEFLAWVELWISGEYEMSELRSRYNDLTARRAQQLRRSAHDAKTTDILGTDPDLCQSTDQDAD